MEDLGLNILLYEKQTRLVFPQRVNNFKKEKVGEETR